MMTIQKRMAFGEERELFPDLNHDWFALILDSDHYGLGNFVSGIAPEVRRVGRRVDRLSCLYNLCPDALNLERLFSLDDVCDLMAVRMHMQGQPVSRLPRRCKDHDFLTWKVI